MKVASKPSGLPVNAGPTDSMLALRVQGASGIMSLPGHSTDAPFTVNNGLTWKYMEFNGKIWLFIKNDGLTVSLISHDIQVTHLMCNRRVVMRNGKLLEIAETETLFNAPTHEYTRRIPTLMKLGGLVSKPNPTKT